MKTIEFVGPPGSGKTTVARRLVKQLQDLGIQVELVDAGFLKTRKPSVVELLRAIFPASRDFAKNLPWTISANQQTFLSSVRWGRVFRVLMRTMLSRVIAERSLQNGPGIVVLEPGALMVALNAGMYSKLSRGNGWSSQPLSKIRVADLIVILSVSEEVATNRMDAREHGRPTRMRTLPKEAQIEVVTRASTLVAGWTHLDSLKESQVLQIETSKLDPDEIVRIILEKGSLEFSSSPNLD